MRISDWSSDVCSSDLEWWCPKPWHAIFEKLERRACGLSNCTMYGPDGEVQPNSGMVLAWDEGKRFAFTDAIIDDLEPAGPFMIGIWKIGRESCRERVWQYC